MNAQPEPSGHGTRPLLEVRQLEVSYGSAVALQQVSLEVPAGGVLAVIGPNGSGKSTIARAVSGLVRARSGSIRFDGIDIGDRPAPEVRRLGLVHLPEGRGTFTALTVEENLRMAAAVVPRRERRSAVERAYDIFPALASRRRQAAGTLSGGEQQMVSLARALVVDPKLIVADELSLGLAPLMVDLIFESLDRARTQGTAIMLIEQYVYRAISFADRCSILSRGREVWSGPAVNARREMESRFGSNAAMNM
ncbi:MAG TPA: ABC transporter ATP-binding protein [Trebonia sp.]|nr:ABC transporter ATP-binding protein [Trebonia sp.]